MLHTESALTVWKEAGQKSYSASVQNTTSCEPSLQLGKIEPSEA